jgi:hypothetical protein
MLGFGLFALSAAVATPLLLFQAVAHTSRSLLDAGPSLVVRRLDPGGWLPIRATEALERASKVAGVTAARARIWGLVTGPDGSPLTVQAFDSPGSEQIEGLPVPLPGQAVVGPGASVEDADEPLVLVGREERRLEVIAVAVGPGGFALHDRVLVHEEDARALLGIPPGYASDLAVWVFHDSEQEAILPDLASAFAWPTRITTRREAVGRMESNLARRGGFAMMMVLPALLGLALLILVSVRERFLRRRDVGILKALGWTSGDVVRWTLSRAWLVAVPALTAGLALAYALVFWPGCNWPARWILGWSTRAPALYLDPGPALLVLLEVIGLLGVPFLAAHLWAGVKLAGTDPMVLLQHGSGQS